jgi:hypothetical protein
VTRPTVAGAEQPLHLVEVHADDSIVIDGSDIETASPQVVRQHPDRVGLDLSLRSEDLRSIAQFLERSTTPSKYLEAVLASSLAERRVVTGSLIAGAVSIGLAGLTDHSSPAAATPDGRVSGG